MLCFLTELDSQSYPLVLALILKYLGGGKATNLLQAPIPKPPQGGHINIEGFWLQCGSEPHIQHDYILTDTVRQNLKVGPSTALLLWIKLSQRPLQNPLFKSE